MMIEPRPTSDGVGHAFANFFRYVGLASLLMFVLILAESLTFQSEFSFLSAIASSLYGSSVFLPLFFVSGLMFVIALQFGRSVFVWLIAALVTYPVVPFLYALWLAPGCRFSKVWEPLCSAEIGNAVTLSVSDVWIFVASHLVASSCLIWMHLRRSLRKTHEEQRQAV